METFEEAVARVARERHKTQRVGRGPEIGWERWVDGELHVLERGKHFRRDAYNTRVTFNQWARRAGFKSHASVIDEDTFVLQVTGLLEGLSDEKRERAVAMQAQARGETPSDEVPADDRPSDEPSDEVPADDQPSDEVPVDEEPSDEDPVAARRARVLADRESLERHSFGRGPRSVATGRRRRS